MSGRASGRWATLSQAVAILCLACMLSVIFHKGYHDIAQLGAQHSGKQFWVALGRYFIGNLAGGAKKVS